MRSLANTVLRNGGFVWSLSQKAAVLLWSWPSEHRPSVFLPVLFTRTSAFRRDVEAIFKTYCPESYHLLMYLSGLLVFKIAFKRCNKWRLCIAGMLYTDHWQRSMVEMLCRCKQSGNQTGMHSVYIYTYTHMHPTFHCLILIIQIYQWSFLERVWTETMQWIIEAPLGPVFCYFCSIVSIRIIFCGCS